MKRAKIFFSLGAAFFLIPGIYFKLNDHVIEGNDLFDNDMGWRHVLISGNTLFLFALLFIMAIRIWLSRADKKRNKTQ